MDIRPYNRQCDICGVTDEDKKIMSRPCIGIPISGFYCEDCLKKEYMDLLEWFYFIANSDNRDFIINNIDFMIENFQVMTNNKRAILSLDREEN